MSGIKEVTKSPLALTAPEVQAGPEPHTYGVAFPFQVAPRLAGVFVCLRNEGYPVGDFENGSDVILFDRLSHISTGPTFTITRNDKYINSQGQKRIVIKYPILGGFVPLGAKTSSGKPHPHAGTGFGLSEASDFPMKGDGYYDKVDKITNMVRLTEVRQFAYDGQNFKVTHTDVYDNDSLLRPPGSEWGLIWPGLRIAIPDGEDFLYPVLGTIGDARGWHCNPSASGVSRWRRQDGRWSPVSFVPIAFDYPSQNRKPPNWLESSLVRDVDGSLLFTARGCYDDLNHVIRLWRSLDSGQTWNIIIDLPDARGQAPVTLNQAVDGTPYIVGNRFGHERDWLCIWPLNADRTNLEEPITVRNALEEFGPPPTGPVWFMDHPTGATVQLADGQWHHLLSYRNMDRGEHAGADPTPYTGQYLEEVISTGPAIAPWNFP